MKRYLPIVIVLVVLMAITAVLVNKKSIKKETDNIKVSTSANIGIFNKNRSCVKMPEFLAQLHIPQPVMIDLSQQHYKGIALLYGKQMQHVLHPKLWEKYEHFSTYTLDRRGNIFLIPTPLISIRPTTFNLQKNLYQLDSRTGKLNIFMHFDDVHPSSNNPYGLSAIAYDCDDNTLWVASLDETDYAQQHGVIYHIDIATKQILKRIDGVDALTLGIVKSKEGKYLLLGAARDNGLYAYDMAGLKDNNATVPKPKKLLELPNDNEHIRKIKIKGHNKLELQSIPFSYTLIAQTAKKDRLYYDVLWNEPLQKWEIIKH